MALSVLTKTESEKKAALLDALLGVNAINSQVFEGIKREISNWPEIKDLADYLESHNIVNRMAINQAMAKILNLEFIELPQEPNVEVMQLIPRDVCISYQIVVYKKDDKKVWVAVANPARIKENKRGVLSEIKSRERLQFNLVVTSVESFWRWINAYPASTATEKIVIPAPANTSLQEPNIDTQLIAKIPVAIASKYRMVVYGKEGDSYLLAVENPSDEKVTSAIKFIEENNKIKFVVKQFNAKFIDQAIGLYSDSKKEGGPKVIDHSVLLKIPKAVAEKFRFVAYKMTEDLDGKQTFSIATDKPDNEEDKRIWQFIEQHNNIKLFIEKVDSERLNTLLKEYDNDTEILKLPDAKIAKWLLPAPMAHPVVTPLPSAQKPSSETHEEKKEAVDKQAIGVMRPTVNPTPQTTPAKLTIAPSVVKSATYPMGSQSQPLPEESKSNTAEKRSDVKSESGFHNVLVSLGLAHGSVANTTVPQQTGKPKEKNQEAVILSQLPPVDMIRPYSAPAQTDATQKEEPASARLGAGTFNTPAVTPSSFGTGVGLSNVGSPIVKNTPPIAPSVNVNSANPPANSQNNDEEEDDLGSLLSKDVQTIEELQKIITEGFIPRMVAAIVSYAITLRASDIHIEAEINDVRVRCRVDGMLQDIIRLPLEQHAAIVSRIKILAKLKIDETRIPQDGRFDVKFKDRAVDLRVSSMPTVHGEKIVLRILDKTHGILSLEDLGVVGRAFDIVIEAIKKPYGIVLSTGPTGSGKSTTLYAILNRISTPSVNIITLEDPVEYEITGVNQSQIKPKIGFTFAEGLRSVLRQDPNVVMVGEIRDSETANMATHAALTGHLVLSTLHTNDAPGALPRLINMGVEPFLITSSINAIIGQRLVRKVCQNCKEPAQIPPAVIAEIQEELNAVPENNAKDRARMKPELVFFHGKGCERCQNGYKGRIGIYEVMSMSSAVEDLAIKKAAASEIKKQAIVEGMITMKQDGLLKALEGLTTVDEVMRETAV